MALDWLPNDDFPFAIFQQRQRQYLRMRQDRFPVLLTSLDLAVPAQYGFISRHEPVPTFRKALIDLHSRLYLQTPLDMTQPAQVIRTQDPARLPSKRLPFGQDVRYADPYLSIPPPGWLLYEDQGRLVRKRIAELAPERSQDLGDLFFVTPTILVDSLRDLARPRGKFARPEAAPQTQTLDPSPQAPFMTEWLVQAVMPIRPRRTPAETAIVPVPFLAGAGQLSYADPTQLPFLAAPSYPLRGAKAPVAGGTDFPVLVIGVSMPGSWMMGLERPLVGRPRAGGHEARPVLPAELLQADVHGWEALSQKPPYQVRQVQPGKPFTFATVDSKAIQIDPQPTYPIWAYRDALGRRSTVSPGIEAAFTADDTSGTSQSWDVQPQIPHLGMTLFPRQRAEFMPPNLVTTVLIVGPPFFGTAASIYFAGAFQADSESEA